MKLFLKGARCEIAKRAHPPGEHPWARKKRSEYGHQLREKQKAKRTYGVFERSFRKLFALANRQKGNTGENLIKLLERRLDNVVYLCGFAHSRSHARQMIVHGHVRLNGKRATIGSMRVKAGDVVTVRDRAKSKKMVEVTHEATKHRGIPSWLQVDPKAFEGKVLELPKREEAAIDLQEQLIVEFCSK